MIVKRECVKRNKILEEVEQDLESRNFVAEILFLNSIMNMRLIKIVIGMSIFQESASSKSTSLYHNMALSKRIIKVMDIENGDDESKG